MYKLMLVDDNFVQLQCLISYIDKEKFNISEMKTSQSDMEAIEICKSFRPDIVITDISMPEIDGIELTKKLNELNLNSQFIYISCFDDIKYFKNAIENDILAYLIKPIIPEELTKALIKATNRISKDRTNINTQMVLRENFLHLLINSQRTDTLNISQSVIALHMDKYKKFILIKLNFQNGSMFNSFDNISTIRDYFENSNNIIIVEDKNNVLILYMYEDDKKDNSSNELRHIICDKIKEISTKFSLTVRAGTSDLTNNLIHFNEIYKQANRALSDNIQFVKSDYISYSDMSKNTSNFNFIQYNEKIISIINNKSTKVVIKNFTEETENQITKYDDNLLKELYLSTMSTLQNTLQKNNIDISAILGRKDFSYHKINRFKNTSQFSIWLYNILTMVT